MNSTSPKVRALVVYESMFGCTEEIARAIAAGMQHDDVDVTMLEVTAAANDAHLDTDLLVIGAPTHAFSLSRPSTRADAVRQGADRARQASGLREWLGATPSIGTNASPRLAVFDTRVEKVRRLPRAAGPRASQLARRRGLRLLSKPVAFLVEGVKGPLVAGEIERAADWGSTLVSELRAQTPAAHTSAFQPKPDGHHLDLRDPRKT